MKNVRNLLAAIVIFAMLPFANVAHAQVVVYNHGHRVRVANTASKTWSNIKSDATTESHKVSNTATNDWNRLRHRNNATVTTTTTYQSRPINTYQPATTRPMNSYQSRTMSMRTSLRSNNGRTFALRSRTRTELIRHRVTRKHHVSSYRASLSRQR